MVAANHSAELGFGHMSLHTLIDPILWVMVAMLVNILGFISMTGAAGLIGLLALKAVSATRSMAV